MGILTKTSTFAEEHQNSELTNWPALQARRRRSAELLQRIFEVDPHRCPRCGGTVKILAFVVDHDVVHAILNHSVPESPSRFNSRHEIAPWRDPRPCVTRECHSSPVRVGVGLEVRRVGGPDERRGRREPRANWTGPGGPRPDIGVRRSDDHGRTWRSIGKGLPSDFRFPIAVHPHDADTVYVMPHEPETRTCPGGAPAVWRSENGGGSWRKLAVGLPKKETYFTVQRDAMSIDRLPRPALYFGTTTGQLWIGRQGDEKFECLFDALPPIHNVKVAVV